MEKGTLKSRTSTNIEEISCRQFGNPLIAQGAFGTVSIAIQIPASSNIPNEREELENIIPPMFRSKDLIPTPKFVAVKTIRNALVSKNQMNVSIISNSWGFSQTETINDVNEQSSNITATNNTSSTIDDNKGYQFTSPVFHEVAALRTVGKHPNITPLLSTFVSPRDISHTSLSLTFPYHPIDLASIISSRRRKTKITTTTNSNGNSTGFIPINYIKSIMRDILSGIAHCHKKGILHCDIKPANLLIAYPEGRVKLTDFGLARLSKPPSGNQPQNQHGIGTLHYRPPEILFSAQDYDESVDIWSSGLIFAELCILTPLFPGRNVLDQLGRIFEVLGVPNESDWPQVITLPDYGKVRFSSLSQSTSSHDDYGSKNVKNADSASTPSNIGSDGVLTDRLIQEVPQTGHCTYLRELIGAMITMNPAKRPSATECLTHSWFFSRPLAVSSSIIANEFVSKELGVSPDDFKTIVTDVTGISKNGVQYELDDLKRKGVEIAEKRRKLHIVHQESKEVGDGCYSKRIQSNGLLNAMQNFK